MPAETISEQSTPINTNETALSIKELLLEEQEKLALYKKIHQQLNEILPAKKKNDESEENETKHLWLKKGIYYFLLLFGLLEDGIGSYIFAQSLLILIPGMPNPLLIAGGVLVAVINSVLFYAFEASMFKKALGIDADRKERNSLVQMYLEEVQLLNTINKQMFDVQLIQGAPANYAELAETVLSLNMDMQEKQARIGQYQESVLQKVLRWFITGFGAFLTIAGSYFMGSSMLGLIAAPLLGTPVGWILIGLMIVAGLGFYFSMQGKGMHELVNPEFKDFKQLNSLLKTCDIRDEKDFQYFHTIQQELKQNRTDFVANESDYHSKPFRFFEPQEALKPVQNDLQLDNLISIQL